MRITHLAVDLGLWYQGCNRVHDDNVYCTGADHGLGNLQRLLAVVRLGNVKVVDVHTDVLRVYRVQGMLSVDETGNTAALLHLSYHMERYGCFTTGLRSVDLDDTALRHTAKAQCDIQADGTGRDGLDVHVCTGISQLHDRTFSVRLLNLCNGSIQCF